MMASVARSTLHPPPQPLTYPLLLAVGLHLMIVPVFACAGLLERLRPPPPMIEPKAMEVSMLVLKKSKRLPTRATRPRENRGDTVQKTATNEPVPIRQSDLSIHTPEAKPTQGKPDQSAERNRAMRELTMAAALSEFDEADNARDASSPEGDGDETIDLGGRGVRVDPELARYIAQLQKIFNQHFRPLPSIVAGNPNLRTRVRIAFDDTGALTGFEVVAKSGNASYDRSAESAVQAVSKVPLPPEKYRDQSFVVEFSPP